MVHDSDEKPKLVTSSSITATITEDERSELNELFDTIAYYIDVKKIAFLSDIHSNMVAFEAVLKDLEVKKFDIAVSLGDLVGYYTEPNQVIESSKLLFTYRVMGNHDFAAIEPRELLFTTLNKDAQHALTHNRGILTREHVDYLRDQPMKMIIDTPYGSITAVHGDPLTIFGYIYGDTEEEMEEAIKIALSHTTTDYLLVGHTHIQGMYKSDNGKIYINPGAVGQPRDNDPRAAYAILDLETKEVELHRVEYDIKKVQGQIHQCSFPESLGTRLVKGK